MGLKVNEDALHGAVMDRISPTARSRVMSRIGGKNTAPELVVREILRSLGVRYRLHVRGLPGVPDIVNRRRRIAIFVHGCFWHGHNCKRGAAPASNREFWNKKLAANKKRDRASAKALRKSGWRVFTIWECQLKNLTKAKIRIASWLQKAID